MRKIVANTFVTLDGVMQAPGGPEEDPTGGFKYGGWSVNYWDEMMSKVMMDEVMAKPFDLLLGRKTYVIFVTYWPFYKNDPDKLKPMVADKFSRQGSTSSQKLLLKRTGKTLHSSRATP